MNAMKVLLVIPGVRVNILMIIEKTKACVLLVSILTLLTFNSKRLLNSSFVFKTRRHSWYLAHIASAREIGQMPFANRIEAKQVRVSSNTPMITDYLLPDDLESK